MARGTFIIVLYILYNYIYPGARVIMFALLFFVDKRLTTKILLRYTITL